MYIHSMQFTDVFSCHYPALLSEWIHTHTRVVYTFLCVVSVHRLGLL